jgi:hypothetical protein
MFAPYTLAVPPSRFPLRGSESGSGVQCFAKLHLPAHSGQEGTGGMLMVYNESCNAIAKCSQPGPEAEMRYSLEQQAWVWDGHAHCSMLIHSHVTKVHFEGAVRPVEISGRDRGP